MTRACFAARAAVGLGAAPWIIQQAVCAREVLDHAGIRSDDCGNRAVAWVNRWQF